MLKIETGLKNWTTMKRRGENNLREGSMPGSRPDQRRGVRIGYGYAGKRGISTKADEGGSKGHWACRTMEEVRGPLRSAEVSWE